VSPTRINTLEELYEAAQAKRAVVLRWRGSRHLPAAWVINLPGSVLYRELKEGIYLYEKPIRDGRVKKEAKP
jgi:hypothetical protein